MATNTSRNFSTVNLNTASAAGLQRLSHHLSATFGVRVTLSRTLDALLLIQEENPEMLSEALTRVLADKIL